MSASSCSNCSAVWLHYIRSRIVAQNEPFKLELLDSIPDCDSISLYHIGDEWWDLCRGPHVASTKQLNSKAISLDSVAGAYWRGDERRPMLQVLI